MNSPHMASEFDGSGVENGRDNVRGAVDGGAGSVLLCIVAYFNILCFLFHIEDILHVDKYSDIT